jgi:hypothetical protein
MLTTDNDSTGKADRPDLRQLVPELRRRRDRIVRAQNAREMLLHAYAVVMDDLDGLAALGRRRT